jgi:hypothetical protein
LVAVVLTGTTPLAVVTDVNVTLFLEGPPSVVAVLQMLLPCGVSVRGTSVATKKVS